MPKLTKEQIEEINVLYKQNKSSTELGKQFGVDHTTILYHVNPEIKRKRGYKSNNPKELQLKVIKPKSKRILTGSYYQELLKKNNPKELPISILYKHRMIKK